MAKTFGSEQKVRCEMPAVGSNIQTKATDRVIQHILEKLGLKKSGTRVTIPAVGRRSGAADAGTTFPRNIAFLAMDGAPQDSTATDAPTGVGDLCYDFTNNDVYRCTAYTSGTVFTWVKIVD